MVLKGLFFVLVLYGVYVCACVQRSSLSGALVSLPVLVIVTSPDVEGTGTPLRCEWLHRSRPPSGVSTSYEHGVGA